MKKYVSAAALFCIFSILLLISSGCQGRAETPKKIFHFDKHATLAQEIKNDIDHVQNVRLEKWLTIDRYSESWAQFVQNVRDLQKAMADIMKKVEELENSLLEDKKQYADDDGDED
jgi:uncharacterized protein YukE